MTSSELVGVGAFVQLSGLTVDALRHYHQVGLLVPVEVDDRTGYRRYRLRQLTRARTLAALRDVAMPLEDAAAVVDATDRGVRRARLIEHRLRLTEVARRAAGRVDSLDRMIDRDGVLESPLRIEEGMTMLSGERLARELLGTLERTDFGHLGVRHEGKVRDSYVDGGVRTIVTTDRLSAFDRQATLTHGLSNARVEAVNTKLRQIMRRSFGFHSPEPVIAPALVSLGGLCPPLPPRYTTWGITHG